MLARDRSWLAWIPVLVCLAAGCRGKSTDAPVTGHHELCCKAANADNVSFVGCRASNYCRAGEEVWVRGPVRCTGGGECALAVEVAALEPEAESDAAAEPPPEAPPPAPVVAPPPPVEAPPPPPPPPPAPQTPPPPPADGDDDLAPPFTPGSGQ